MRRTSSSSAGAALARPSTSSLARVPAGAAAAEAKILPGNNHVMAVLRFPQPHQLAEGGAHEASSARAACACVCTCIETSPSTAVG